MHGSRWRYIVAAVGWLILGGQAPQPEAKAEQGKAGGEVAQARPATSSPSVQSVETLQRPILERPCEPGTDERQSDLCAQWKAADSAAQAAKWAKWSFFLGAIGTLGLFWTLFYTRKAVRLANDTAQDAQEAIAIAARNADAATRHVEVALQTSYAQLRPWLKLDVKGNVCRRITESENQVAITVTITNGGVSPAFQAGISTTVKLIIWTGDMGPIDLPHNMGMFAPIFRDEPIIHTVSYQPKFAEVEALTGEAWTIGAMPTIVFDFKISYRAAFSPEIKESAFRYLIFGQADDIGWLARFRPINTDITPRIELRQQPDDVMT